MASTANLKSKQLLYLGFAQQISILTAILFIGMFTHLNVCLADEIHNFKLEVNDFEIWLIDVKLYLHFQKLVSNVIIIKKPDIIGI